MEFEIDEVADLDRAWPELAPLFSELHEYHKPLTGVVLLDDWEARQREHVAFGTDEALVLIARSEGRAIGFTNARIARNPSIFEERFGAIDKHVRAARGTTAASGFPNARDSRSVVPHARR